VIFLSHSSQDKPKVRRLAEGLTHAGFSVWLDEWQIRVGDCIPTSIERGLETCRFLVVVLSPAAVASEWVSREWKARYWDEVNEGRIRVLPVVAEECSLPALLRTKKHVLLTSDFDAGLAALVASLRSYIAEDSARDFYAYAPVVLRKVRQDPDRRGRNEYWDQYDDGISQLSGRDKFRAQRANSLNYLRMWHLSVEQLRVALGALGYPTPAADDVTEGLVSALERFQQDHCMRHVDGIFGELTYAQMYALHRQAET
jgi:hypothetical protein